MKHLKLLAATILFGTGELNAQKDSAMTSSNEKERPFQFTFISPIGTNGLECYKHTNRFSLNMLVGVARGLHGFEAGGIANVILKDVKGVQMAGFANVVLGNVKGAQLASYINYSGKNLKGISAAGLCNLNMGEMQGGQFAGFFNFNRSGGKGIQIAGYTNVTGGDLKGTQISAFANIATKSIEGAQLSAGVNYAKKVKGIQLGFVNIADTVDGASIGFFNFVRKGKHQVELSGDEMFYTNISYRTGTTAFYNIFTLGFQPGSKQDLWHFGYGAGTSFKLKEKLYGDISATAHHVNTGGFYWGTSELLRFYVGVEYKVAKKFSIAAGPTFNMYMSDLLLTGTTPGDKEVAPYHTFNHNTVDDFNLKGWVGGRIALRFL